MKELKLVDRVVVEVKTIDNKETDGSTIAGMLRHIADRIEDGQKGEVYFPEDGVEVLYERECPYMGGFRILSDKSLISQYYYKSEPKPHILPDDIAKSVKEWNVDIRKEYEDGAPAFTQDEMMNRAMEIMDAIQDEFKL